MTIRKTRPPAQVEQVRTDGDSEAGEGPDALQQQAALYGDIARRALEECTNGMRAEDALARRRNRSGQ
jgi:hypothetical protein